MWLIFSLTRWRRVFARIERLPVPSIAVINGHCLGGGLELAMCCDFRLCKKCIKIGLPEINIGMIPGWGGAARLPRIVGLGRAKEMILLAKLLDADTAKDYGLVNEVYESYDELKQGAAEYAQKLMSLPPHVIALDKLIIDDAYKTGPNAVYDCLALAYCFTTSDSIEGLDAFLEKRKPVFSGQ